MTSNGTFATLQGWGLTVCTSDPNSIKNTSIASPHMPHGKCN